MSSSNCCFLTCIQVSQEAGQVVWYFHLFQNFLQFIVIHTVKGTSVVNEAEVDVFLEFSCLFYDPVDVGNLSLVPLPFLNLAWTSRSFQFAYSWILAWRILSIALLLLLLLSRFSRVWLFATPWTAAYQAPPSMGFSRQEYWSGVPSPSLERQYGYSFKN